ncbi:MAG: TIGR04282 family arsenosugar biosynthesis glycosyltransferase [candidate division NC10 bacterium]|nr:TIGR04282 family arsenosugar biosynthesis glycosyltransferase [candidate division NC10 bacterium]
MRRHAIAVMAKAPRAGEVKTRLVPPLSHEEAAELYRCLLLDKLHQVGDLSEVDPYLAYTPADARDSILSLAPQGFALIPQAGSDLGDRLHRLSAILLERGHPAAVIIDSDTPTLPTTYLVEANARLQSETTDMVLGPTEDGGYYLIGLKHPCRALFDGIPWSSPAVFNETLQRASAQRLRVSTLPPWFDVDTPDDLVRLRHDLATNGNALAPYTRGFLLNQRGD